MDYVLASVEGLHLTCDFAIYSAALYGCPPNYEPTPTGVHVAFKEIHQILGDIPFAKYDRLTPVSSMDSHSLETLCRVENQRIKDFTSVVFEFDRSAAPCPSFPDPDAALLKHLLERAERILDTIRLFVFAPGESLNIGRVGAIGNGVCGAWIGNRESAKFIARKLLDYQRVQPPMEVSLDDVRNIHNDPVFRELHSAGCSSPHADDPLLARIFDSLRAFRRSREVQHPETRFLELVRIAEYLAKRDINERLQGQALRDRIARIAQKGTDNTTDFLTATSDLWDKVRNPLTHSVTSFALLGRDASFDLTSMEEIVIQMIRAVTIAWRNEQFGIVPYDFLLVP